MMLFTLGWSRELTRSQAAFAYDILKTGARY